MELKSGSFCWVELGTTDQNAAKRFYSSMLGWKADDQPMGPDAVYTLFRINGKDAGGLYTLNKEQVAQGVPPHWMLYVKVDSADASAANALKLGAKQLMVPFDIPDVGRVAILQDPTGAAISIFQPGRHRGLAVWGELNALCWADLNTPDPPRAATFYADWFGWTYETGKDGYRHIINGRSKDDMIGGIPARMSTPPGTPAHWMSYFHVADCKATAAKAAQLGASTIVPADLMPDVGTIAALADPQGAVFALYQPLNRG
jgi:predicted enzyme related to lactoylglutathione lyase